MTSDAMRRYMAGEITAEQYFAEVRRPPPPPRPKVDKEPGTEERGFGPHPAFALLIAAAVLIALVLKGLGIA